MGFKVAIAIDEDGMYIAECLNLPGCISEGKTKEEAVANIRDAIKGYLDSLKKHHEPIPLKNITQIMELTIA